MKFIYYLLKKENLVLEYKENDDDDDVEVESEKEDEDDLYENDELLED